MTKAELQKENEKLQARIRVLEGQQKLGHERADDLGVRVLKYAQRAEAMAWALCLAQIHAREVETALRKRQDSLALAT